MAESPEQSGFLQNQSPSSPFDINNYELTEEDMMREGFNPKATDASKFTSPWVDGKLDPDLCRINSSSPESGPDLLELQQAGMEGSSGGQQPQSQPGTTSECTESQLSAFRHSQRQDRRDEFGEFDDIGHVTTRPQYQLKYRVGSQAARAQEGTGSVNDRRSFSPDDAEVSAAQQLVREARNDKTTFATSNPPLDARRQQSRPDVPEQTNPETEGSRPAFFAFFERLLGQIVQDDSRLNSYTPCAVVRCDFTSRPDMSHKDHLRSRLREGNFFCLWEDPSTGNPCLYHYKRLYALKQHQSDFAGKHLADTPVWELWKCSNTKTCNRLELCSELELLRHLEAQALDKTVMVLYCLLPISVKTSSNPDNTDAPLERICGMHWSSSFRNKSQTLASLDNHKHKPGLHLSQNPVGEAARFRVGQEIDYIRWRIEKILQPAEPAGEERHILMHDATEFEE
ncbi:hypothetical protein BJ508DRAFT_314102 [Ascobolus immersus RN42]|uniref:Uncharacterized protein n=1 Tax=Ascobolus immersus RN42 TaxID=1160509 RepID=A0A3N4HMM5_ASCIM|nr:hypothetical protein BJ508DRAFT_314102 [Ascobolus immersus RN42]